MATIGDVARMAGVSTTLVSRYLNQVKGVGPASKERIESAIRELNYVPDESARMLVRKRGTAAMAETPNAAPAVPSVAMYCEDVDAQYVTSFYLGAKHVLWSESEESRRTLLLFLAMPAEFREADESAALEYIRRTCAGLLCVSSGTTPLAAALRELSLPVVHLMPAEGSKSFHRGSREFRTAEEEFEEASARAAETLLHEIAQDGRSVGELFLRSALTVTDDGSGERSPIGRTMQSHLL